MDDVDLLEARRRFPLPEGVADLVVNRTELAELLDTSENMITDWLGRGMPCLEQGSNGRPYKFQFSDCYAWRESWLEADRQRKETISANVAQMRMGFANDDSLDERDARLTPKEIKEQSEAHLLRMRAAEMRGELVRVDRVAATAQQMLERVRRTIITLPDFAEREFGLNPDQVQKLERRGFAVLSDMRRDLEDLLAGGDVVDLDGGDEAADG